MPTKLSNDPFIAFDPQIDSLPNVAAARPSSE